MSNRIATEQYAASLGGKVTPTPTKCATKSKVESYGLKVNGTYQDIQLVKENDVAKEDEIFVTNTMAGDLYIINSGIPEKITISGANYFTSIAGGYGLVGALSMDKGLYVLNPYTSQWENRYEDVSGTTYAHLARFDGGWVFYKLRQTTYRVMIVYDDGRLREYNLVAPAYSIACGPYNYCSIGTYSSSIAKMYTITLDSLPESLTPYSITSLTPNTVVQGYHQRPRGVTYGYSRHSAYYSNDPAGITWKAATKSPIFGSVVTSLYADNKFIIIGDGCKLGISTDGGITWNSDATIAPYDISDLIYEDSNWYAVGIDSTNSSKRFMVKSNVLSLYKVDKQFDLPDYTRQIVKFKHPEAS